MSRQDKTAKAKFEQFLKRNNSYIGTISSDTAIKDLFPHDHDKLKLTQFDAFKDTFLYAKMIEHVVRKLILPKEKKILVDLGAGSSIPTIKAMLAARPDAELKVIAVDSDPNALEVSRQNVRNFGLEAHYEFVQADMLDYLKNIKIEKRHAIVANPPYLPVPEDASGYEFLPVNGGRDGLKYLRVILNKTMPKGTILAIRWSSLTSPAAMIEMIESNYAVDFIEAHRAKFVRDQYVSTFFPYFEKVKDDGIACYDNENGELYFTMVSTVIRRK